MPALYFSHWSPVRTDDVLSRKFSEHRWNETKPLLTELVGDHAEFVRIWFSWRPASPDPGDDHVTLTVPWTPAPWWSPPMSGISGRLWELWGWRWWPLWNFWNNLTNGGTEMNEVTLQLPKTRLYLSLSKTGVWSRGGRLCAEPRNGYGCGLTDKLPGSRKWEPTPFTGRKAAVPECDMASSPGGETFKHGSQRWKGARDP